MSARQAVWAARGMVVAVLAAAPASLSGQVSEALTRSGDGVVVFTYAARSGTRFCGDGGHSISVGRGVRMELDGRRGLERCREGSALVEVTMDEGVVTDVRFLGPDEAPAPAARNLGRVSADESARAFLRVARADGPATDEALVGAVVADSVVVWPDLLDIARDRDLADRTRKSALFWLGQEAAATVTEALVETADDGSEAEGIRDAAVFALSQRPEGESLPALMSLAKEAAHADTRRSALFWLAQSRDSRVPEFFAEILAGPRPGGDG